MNFNLENSVIELGEDFNSSTRNIICSESENFLHLARIAKLDLKLDFIGTDLAGVDFSDCDLRGVVFRDCDLRGSYGCNVEIDDTTDLIGAEIDNSIFLYASFLSNFKSKEDEAEFKNLKNEFWSRQCTWILDKMKSSNDKVRDFAVKLFFETDDITVKTEILLRLGAVLTDKDEFKNFIINVIMRSPEDLSSVRAAVVAARAIVDEDYLVFSTLLSYLKRAEFGFAKIILLNLMRSRYFGRHADEIKNFIDLGSDSETRRRYVESVNNYFKYGPSDHFKDKDGRYFDYLKTIDIRQFLDSVIGRYSAQIRKDLRYQKSFTEKEKLKYAADTMKSHSLSRFKNISKLRNQGIYIFNFGRKEISGVDWESRVSGLF